MPAEREAGSREVVIDPGVSGSTRAAVGSTVPSAADVRIIWTISSGSPDYEVLTGDGSLTSDGFDLPLIEPLRSDAMNTYGDFQIGIGVVAAYPAGTGPAEGIATDEDFESRIGASPRYAIIYRRGSDADFPADFLAEEPDIFFLDFPEGYSCGRGVANDGGFDDFEPVDCREVELLFGDLDSFDFVNWT